MVDLIITSGQHRNEKSAVALAPLLVDSLRAQGYDLLHLVNQEQ